MKLTIKSGADHTEIVRYESNAVGFVAISGVTRGAPAAVSAVSHRTPLPLSKLHHYN
jgi:hypothetical protein